LAVNIPAVCVTTTKLADGNVRFDFYNSLDGVNPGSFLRFSSVMTSANVTAINSTVNGGATGTTLSQVYAAESNRGDYVNDAAFAI
jgi:hypothetical protein